MPNEKLLATLQETRREIVDRRYTRMDRLQAAREGLDNARHDLRRAQDQERLATQADEDVKAKMEGLRNYLNGLTDPPQALHEKLNSLGQDQLGTFRKRQAASEITRDRQRQITEAETQMAVAEQQLQSIEKNLAELDSKIRELQGY